MRIAALFVTLMLAASAFAADVNGKWKAVFKAPEGDMEVIFDLAAEGKKVTGVVSSEMGEEPIRDGTIDGDQISFTVETEQFVAVHKGTVSGDEMKLTVEVGEHTMEITAKRVKS